MHFRVQHLQWLGGIVAAAACLALGGVSLQANLADHARYQQGSEQLSRFHAVLIAANAISSERGPANSAMGGPEADRSALISALQAKRWDTDSRIGEMETAFAQASARSEEVRRLMREVRQRLTDGRVAVDSVVAVAAGDRHGPAVTRAIETMFAAADSVLALRDRLGQEIIRLNPEISTEIILNTTAGSLREETGRLGSYVVMMLTADEGRSAQFLPRFDQTLVRLTELRGILSSYAAPFFGHGPMAAKAREMDERYFGSALPYAQTVAGSLVLPGGPDAATFTRAYVPGMRPVEELREMIAAESQARMNEMRDRAFNLVLLSGLLTAVAILALAIIAIIFRNGLFRPLITVRERITAIAQGDLSEPPPVAGVSSEIRGMFRELDVLRDQQRQRLRLQQDQQRMSEQLRRLSETDMLTGLLNRRALNDAAARAFAEAGDDHRNIAVILFDIDHFKVINDTRGHTVGDQVLQAIALTLDPLVHSSDAFARYGGEEFLVMAQGRSMDSVVALAEAMRQRLEQTLIPEAPGLRITASFGVAIRKSGDAGWEHLVAAADRRLYRAKQAGRNRVCSSDDVVEAPSTAPSMDNPLIRLERFAASRR